MSVLLVLGTRPELTKTSPFIMEMQKQKIPFSFVFTGQHYDDEMSKIFMEEFSVPAPDEYLNLGGMDEFSQIGTGIQKVAQAIQKYKPALCVVNGDTNSTLMSALASAKCAVPVAHIEAGCRSFDYTMPEEINRIVTDRLASLLFAPTEYCVHNLLMEGIERKKIFMPGNTAVDGFNIMSPRAKKLKKSDSLGLEKEEFVLVTLHRKENVDNKANLKELLASLSKLDSTVVFPMHPRTRKRVAEFGLSGLLGRKNIRVIEPIGYLEFLSLLHSCKYALTDSGGVMEEAVMAGKRVIVPRLNAEWYEIFEKKAGFLCPPTEKGVLSAAKKLAAEQGAVPLVYPDYKASEQIAKTIKEKMQEGFVLTKDFFKAGRPVMALDKGKNTQAMFGKDGGIVDDEKQAAHRTAILDLAWGD
jgi:UDP-N-acetylglucosamine 2-epimerase (non-hydrolysing)